MKKTGTQRISGTAPTRRRMHPAGATRTTAVCLVVALLLIGCTDDFFIEGEMET